MQCGTSPGATNEGTCQWIMIASMLLRAVWPGSPAGRWRGRLPPVWRNWPGRASRPTWKPGSAAGSSRARGGAGQIAPTAPVARMGAAGPAATAARARCAPGERAANQNPAARLALAAVERGATPADGQLRAQPARTARCASGTGAARLPVPTVVRVASAAAATRISRVRSTAFRGRCSPLFAAPPPPIARQGRTARISGTAGCVSSCASSQQPGATPGRARTACGADRRTLTPNPAPAPGARLAGGGIRGEAGLRLEDPHPQPLSLSTCAWRGEPIGAGEASIWRAGARTDCRVRRQKPLSLLTGRGVGGEGS